MTAVVELDIVEDNKEMEETYGHLYISGVIGQDGSSRKLLLAQKASGENGWYALSDLATDSDGEEITVPYFEGNNVRVMLNRVAKHFGLHGTVRINNEVTNTTKTWEV